MVFEAPPLTRGLGHTGLCPFKLCATGGHLLSLSGSPAWRFLFAPLSSLSLPVGHSWNLTSTKTYSVPSITPYGLSPCSSPPPPLSQPERACPALVCILTSHFLGGLGVLGPAPRPACFLLHLSVHISPGTYQKLRGRFLGRQEGHLVPLGRNPARLALLLTLAHGAC